MLPALAGRPVTVAPSASWWFATRGDPVTGPVAFAAGPGLGRAAEEVRRAAAGWPHATVRSGPAVTADQILRDAGRASVLHLAAHGRHEPQQPLFSSLELADGPLFGYDLPRAAAIPAHVVLSACDLGLAVVRPGDESLGMTAAFLQAGATSVIASVARVSDDMACEVMPDYHRRLSGGLAPAEALAASLAGTAGNSPDLPAPFVTFGSGWR